ncbi:MAG: hypothetical protein LBH00_02600 [Planctomycetaceae bacterium]|nr:hypothetical protein [Planctomycetaceae bacterium]
MTGFYVNADKESKFVLKPVPVFNKINVGIETQAAAYAGKLADRAALLAAVLKSGNDETLSQMFPRKMWEKKELVLWLRPRKAAEGRTDKTIPPFGITIIDREHGSLWVQNFIQIGFYPQSQKPAYYLERGLLLGEDKNIDFFADGSIKRCEITAAPEMTVKGIDIPAQEAVLEWNKNGEIVTKTNIQCLNKIKLNVSLPYAVPSKQPPPLFPKTFIDQDWEKLESNVPTEAKAAAAYNRAKFLHSIRTIEDLTPCFGWDLIKPSAGQAAAGLYIVKNVSQTDIVCIAVVVRVNDQLQGYCLTSTSKKSVPHQEHVYYAEGVFAYARNVEMCSPRLTWKNASEPLYWTRDLPKYLAESVYWAFDDPVRLVTGVEIEATGDAKRPVHVRRWADGQIQFGSAF